MVAQNYLWCAEKARGASLALLLGLVLNLLLNAIWLPAYGLHGAVLATAVANALSLLTIFYLNRRAGMQVDASTILVSLLPASLGCGEIVAALLTMAVVVIGYRTNWVIDTREKQQVNSAVDRLIGLARRITSSWTPASASRGI